MKKDTLNVDDKKGETIRMEGTLQDVTGQKNHLKAMGEQNGKLREIAWLQSRMVVRGPGVYRGIIYCINLETVQGLEMKEMLGSYLSSDRELEGIVREIENKARQIGNQPNYEVKSVK